MKAIKASLAEFAEESFNLGESTITKKGDVFHHKAPRTPFDPASGGTQGRQRKPEKG